MVYKSLPLNPVLNPYLLNIIFLSLPVLPNASYFLAIILHKFQHDQRACGTLICSNIFIVLPSSNQTTRKQQVVCLAVVDGEN